MSDRLPNDQPPVTGKNRRIVLIADPQAIRRRHLARGSRIHAVIEAASLNEVYPLAEEMVPDVIAMSVDFLADPVIEGVIRLAGMLGSTVMFYTENTTSPLRNPLRERLRCVALRPQDNVDDLIASLSEGRILAPTTDSAPDTPDLVLIGASTGGIAAIESVLMSFPADCPPTLIVQHIRDGFVAGLVQRLNLRCGPRIVAAAQDTPLRRGTVYFAADAERHLTVAGSSAPRCSLISAPPRQGHRPAVDPLFESAISWGGRVSAALLTGMGSDGAAGMGALRRAGALTIAQDRPTSIVWGMPGAAVAAGAAEAVLPLDQIGHALLSGRARPVAKAFAGRAR